ncbi:hypothetical protein TanjilG_08279 [Lupinus angustifolius]|uniref:Acyl-[acyl-carrier-protein] hydrolase n=1 Tax=Lupinus angustifolius TaxID=3871 RepID=A0A1J7H5Q0_LUPAN|nr:PREDICTED: palmitoyl-acyl carrier protein thioesterase, chloroplastic-like [Lupinus angustifolius]OIV97060.1 hypothetical protein TanjilG_08279 [Lupinus angustifolius]
MAATTNIGLQFHTNYVSNKVNMNIAFEARDVLKMGLYSSDQINTLDNKRRFLSSNGGSHIVNKINVMKENVIDVPNESLEDAIVAISRGRFVEDKFVYRQNFVVRSYEIGPDRTVTMETLMSFLQETALNHVPNLGTGGPGDDFGVTLEMSLRKLIWVVTRIQVQVHRYSKWGDEIEVDTWFDVAGKNGMRRDWLVRDHNTKEIIARATSTWVVMNKETRRLSKLPDEVKQEGLPFNFSRRAIAIEETDTERIEKLTDDTAEGIRSGMAPRWNDMDANLHVNNVKYIGWMLESVPKEVLKEYNMSSMTLEYRRECTESDLLESMTSPAEKVTGDTNNNSIIQKSNLQYSHLLRLQDNKAEILRARTQWHLKQKKN